MLGTTTEPIPAILDLEQAIDEFRKTVTLLLDPAQEEQWDGVKLKEKEQAILLAGLRLAGHCVAILISTLVLTESVNLAACLRAKGEAGLQYVRQGFKEVPITLIGGVQVRVKTLYVLARVRRRKRGRKRKRGKSQGQGFYPVLVLLGMGQGVSPLLRCLVTQAATQLPSFEQARQPLSWLGLSFSASRIRRISEAFCAIGLKVRAERLAQYASGELPAGAALEGKRVVVAVDGGRMRIRQPKSRGRKRKSGRRGYDTEWREPKLLSIYVIDERGRKVVRTDVPLVSDGTLMGKDEFLDLLRLYLHQLGIALAEVVVLIGDGAPWIWKNIPHLLTELGCRPEQIVEILDTSHACQHVYQIAEALFGATSQAKDWARKWAKKLKRGHINAFLAQINRCLSQSEAKDPEAVQTQLDYFQEHHQHGRLDYARFRVNKLPVGSGVVESLIRQVVNLRLKSSGKFWLLDAAEAFLHARCQWAAHQWNDFCNAVLTFGLVHLPAT
jgi:hypothetical protein